METILKNTAVITGENVITGHVVVRDGRIDVTEAGPTDAAGAIDFEGDYLLPGLVDLHTDNLEKHFQPRPGVTWDGVGAAIAHDGQVAAAGITTVFDSLSIFGEKNGFNREDNLTPMIEGVQTARDHGLLRVDHRLHLRCETSRPGLPDTLHPHVDNGKPCLLSIMDHTPGRRQYRNWTDEQLMEMAKAYGRTDEEIEQIKREFKNRNNLEYVAENRAVVVKIATEKAIPVASHDDETPEHIHESVADGVTISEFPVTLEASQVAKEKGMCVVMGAPNLLRGGSHSGNVSTAEVVKDGALHALASDYLPLSLLRGAFLLTQAPFNWSLPDAVATVSKAPAHAAGLTDRGEIAPGKRGDLIRVRLTPSGWPQVRGVWREGERVA